MWKILGLSSRGLKVPTCLVRPPKLAVCFRSERKSPGQHTRAVGTWSLALGAPMSLPTPQRQERGNPRLLTVTTGTRVLGVNIYKRGPK